MKIGHDLFAFAAIVFILIAIGACVEPIPSETSDPMIDLSAVYASDSGNFHEQNPASAAWDGIAYGEQSNYPGSSSSGSVWIRFDLGSVHDLSLLRFYPDTNGSWITDRYALEVWDGSAWVTIASRSGVGEQWYEHQLSTSAQHVRIVAESDTGSTQFREMELYGSDTGIAGEPFEAVRNDTALLAVEHPLTTRLIDVTACSGTNANSPTIGGNVITPVASMPDSRDVWVAFMEPDHDVVTVRIDENGACSAAQRINERSSDGGSHDQPAVFIDSEGNRQYFYYGGDVWGEFGWSESAPFGRRVLADGTMLSEEFGGLWNNGEIHGFRMTSGSIFVAGTDQAARYTIIHPDGTREWEHPRQVVSNDFYEVPSPYDCEGNKFTKAVFHEGLDGRLHVTWGRGTGLSHSYDAYVDCPNSRHYSADSHEVYYAFSEDGGLTWQNLDRTRSVEAPLCPDRSDCATSGGIAYNDEDFMVTDTRQRQHRKLFVDPAGHVMLGFVKSVYCNTGVCTSTNVDDPGALMLLEFDLEQGSSSISETMIDSNEHWYFASMQPGDGGTYLYAIDRDADRMTEYFYKDGQVTKNPIKRCMRLAGESYVHDQNVIRLLMECSGDERSVWFYERGVRDQFTG